MKKTVAQVDVEAKFVLMRADFNVPLNKQLQITDDSRIVMAMPTIKNILDRDGRLILCSHLGRPDGKPTPEYSLKPVADHLSKLLGQTVPLVTDYLSDTKPAAVTSLKKGHAVLLENLRYYPAEEIKGKDCKKDEAKKILKNQFARKLADLADVYVNDAFGTCHRDNASMVTVPLLMSGKPRVIGFLVEKELRFLGDALNNPKRPFVCILGGAKVSDKIGVIEALIPKCDTILIGGAMMYTFMLAKGESIGASLSEPDKIEEAKRIIQKAGNKLRLPMDSVCAKEIKEGVTTQACSGAIPAGLKGLDIGSRTVGAYGDVITTAKTIVWNGPMGVFETPPFDKGTKAVAEFVAKATDAGAISVVGGGDSAAAIKLSGLENRITHISTGGGASLEYLEGRPFEAVDILDNV